MNTDRLEELKRVVCARLSKKDRLELLPLIDSAISSTNVTACSTEHSTDSTRGTVHILKCWPEYFQAVKSGAKTFEIRKNDRDYQVGDWLDLHEYDPKTNSCTAEKPIMREVTYLLDAYGFLPPGMVCMGLAAIADQSRQVGDDVQEAMEWVSQIGQGYLYIGTITKEVNSFINTILAALSAYRRPTADEVAQIDRAIAEIISTNYGECQMHRETLVTAITALKKMKGE